MAIEQGNEGRTREETFNNLGITLAHQNLDVEILIEYFVRIQTKTKEQFSSLSTLLVLVYIIWLLT